MCIHNVFPDSVHCAIIQIKKKKEEKTEQKTFTSFFMTIPFDIDDEWEPYV